MADALIVTGPPGAGKSTVARLLAAALHPSVHLHADDFFGYVVGGFVAPWKAEARAQNEAVIRAVLAAARSYRQDGYHVVLDGVLGPWFLDTLTERLGPPSHYVVLLPDLDTLQHRVATRVGHSFRDLHATEHMYRDFDAARAGVERHVLDTARMSAAEVADRILDGLASGCYLLSRPSRS